MPKRYSRIVRKTISQTEGWFQTILDMPMRNPTRPLARKKGERITVGIDPSISGTGLAAFRDGELVYYKAWTEVRKLKTDHPHHIIWFKAKEHDHGSRLARIKMIANWVAEELLTLGAHGDQLTAAIEGYAFAARASSASDLHELGGAIKLVMLELGVPFQIYAPSSVKLAATGVGGADKGDMKIACLKKLNLDVTKYGKAGENIADACMIAWLLGQEMAIRDGVLALRKAPADVRRVLLHTTKAEPVALISRKLISHEEIDPPRPML